MNAQVKRLCRVLVAAAAGLCHIGTVYRRSWIFSRQDCRHVAVDSMTIYTARSWLPVCSGLCVNAVLDGTVRIFMELHTSYVWQSLTRTVTAGTIQIYVRRKLTRLLISC